MHRSSVKIRPDWKDKVEADGFSYHTMYDSPYWDESVAYVMEGDEVEELIQATEKIESMCREAVDRIVKDPELLDLMDVPQDCWHIVKDSWDRKDRPFLGRMDFVVSDKSLKLVEYNSDTPVSILESGLIQRNWWAEVGAPYGQFNSLDANIRKFFEGSSGKIFFACNTESEEDRGNVEYLMSLVGDNVLPKIVDLSDIGIDEQALFVDGKGTIMEKIYKLFPWEEMVRSEYADILTNAEWMEPPWRMLVSNKAILPILWEMFEGDENLIPSFFEAPEDGNFIAKPYFSGEGSNIKVFKNGDPVLETEGDDYDGRYIFQRFVESSRFDGKYPTVGSWTVAGVPSGVGIREDDGPITGKMCRFIPHVVRNA